MRAHVHPCSASGMAQPTDDVFISLGIEPRHALQCALDGDRSEFVGTGCAERALEGASHGRFERDEAMITSRMAIYLDVFRREAGSGDGIILPHASQMESHRLVIRVFYIVQRISCRLRRPGRSGE